MRIAILSVVVFLYVYNSYASNLIIMERGNVVVVKDRIDFFKNAYILSEKYHISKEKILKIIKNISKKYFVNYRLVEAMVKVESNFNTHAISRKGAKGLMQLMNATAEQYGVRSIFNVQENIEGGVRFLKHLLDRYKSVPLALAAYNAGETVVNKYAGLPPYKQTRRYVRDVLSLYNSYNVSTCHLAKQGNTFTNIVSLW